MGSVHNALAFVCRDARSRAAVAGVGALPDFHEHQRAVAVTHDQIDFAAPASGRPIIAGKQCQSGTQQVGCGKAFCRVSQLFFRRFL